MNRVVIVLLATFTLAVQLPAIAQGPLSAKPAPKVRWNESIPNAMKQHRESGRPIVIYVTADYCGFCKKMEREAWSDPQVVRRIQDGFVTLKVDAEQHPELLKRLGVEGLPTTILFNSQGEQVQALSGYTRSETLIESLDAVTSPTPPSAGSVKLLR